MIIRRELADDHFFMGSGEERECQVRGMAGAPGIWLLTSTNRAFSSWPFPLS